MRTIAIVLEKGGVAKSTTAVALAHDLARQDHTTVLVDLDSQGSATASLGIDPAPGVSRLLLGTATLDDVLIEARPKLWLLPSDPSTARLRTMLAGESYREHILSRALAGLDADFVIIDTGPSRDLLHDMAHQASEQVVCPVQVDHLALRGVAQEVESLKTVREHGHSIELLAILPTMFDRVTKESHTNLQELVDAFGDLVLPAVPRATRVRELPAYGQTIWEGLEVGHPVQVAYERLTRRVLHGE